MVNDDAGTPGVGGAPGRADRDRLSGERAVLARVYDRLLGGSHNFGVDRETAEALVAAWPDVTRAARANRHFLRWAVARALDLGVRQFLDLGSGLPTLGSVHDIAQARDPGARVAYVEREPSAIAHSDTMLAGRSRVTVTEADVRDVHGVLTAPGVAGLLDPDEPVALFALSTLHHLADDDDPAGLVAAYRDRLAPGSVLALSHLTDECPEDPEVVVRRRGGAAHLAATFLPVHLRSREGIAALGRAFGVAVADLDDLGRWCAERPGAPLAVLATVSAPTHD